MPGKPYSLHPRRTRKGKPVYYAQFRLANGRWSNAKSTGETSRNRAEAWAIEYLRNGNVVNNENLSFGDFSRDFFRWDGEWATDRKATGRRIGPRHCEERQRLLENHILPFFGKARLSKIDRSMVKEFRNALFRAGYAGGTINKALSTVKTILESAEEKSLIRNLPRFDRAIERPTQKGILTIDEVRALFSLQWPDFRAMAMNLTAAATGLRLGELQALILADVRLADGYITITKSWDRRTHTMNHGTKTGRSRTVLIPGSIREMLARLIALNPYGKPESFVFFSLQFEERPLMETSVIKYLYRGLERIGIDENRRKARNITFHSWRHWFNSLLINARVPLHKIQSITGHLTDEMTQHYYHASPEEMSDVIQAVEETLFPAMTVTAAPWTQGRSDRVHGICALHIGADSEKG